ncbi:GGDEF domain-containing protein [Methylophaga sp. OBS1]|uniref:GGDEF domain-containing protein n=1 Tax=Methylophaga sp. OBS1 TaxID=2991933 RepID=UPI00224EEFF1|nr:GGDEF domain-containing protein [Methylophaga sp. OBS1]MCX4192231.1 GGDEF domain-containing protein [Methylophaga sp. OBS1]
MEQQLPNNNSKLSLVDGGQTAPKPVTTSPTLSAEDLVSRLPGVLQTTLVLEELLPLFEQQLRQVMHFDSFHYQHLPLNCQIDSDSQRHHRCHYKLDMNGQYLGDLTLTRRHKFTETQIALLEDLLCQLVYPLRNCLLYKQAQNSALLDDLTGLGNRAAYDKSLQREIDLAQRQQADLSLIILDIDNFKAINDAYGHSSGDRALKTLAETINQTMRRSDMAFRFGGEEFVLLLSNTDLEAAAIVAERLRLAVSETLCHDGKRGFGFTVSLGVAQLDGEEHGYHLFERADMALYQAKHRGRNTAVCAPPTQQD